MREENREKKSKEEDHGRLGSDLCAVIGLRIIETKICFSHTQTS